MRGRLLGLLFLGGGLAFAWFFILHPLDQMRAGESDIRVSFKPFLITPMLLVAGVGLLIGGNSFLEHVNGPPESRHQWTVMIIMLVVMLAAGGAGFWWFNNQMAALGYSL